MATSIGPVRAAGWVRAAEGQATETAHRQHAEDARAADRERHRRQVRGRLDEPRELLVGVAARVDGDPGERRQLADDDEDGGAVHEARDHRVTQQIDDAAHLQHAQQPEHHAHLEAQNGGDREVRVRVRRGVFADGGGHHQGRYGDRTDHQLPSRTEHGMDGHRREASVEARLRRQPGEKRVGDRLGHGDDAEDQPGDQIVMEVLPPIVREYGRDGDESRHRAAAPRGSGRHWPHPGWHRPAARARGPPWARARAADDAPSP